jgi:hypothetical protein
MPVEQLNRAGPTTQLKATTSRSSTTDAVRWYRQDDPGRPAGVIFRIA